MKRAAGRCGASQKESACASPSSMGLGLRVYGLGMSNQRTKSLERQLNPTPLEVRA